MISLKEGTKIKSFCFTEGVSESVGQDYQSMVVVHVAGQSGWTPWIKAIRYSGEERLVNVALLAWVREEL